MNFSRISLLVILFSFQIFSAPAVDTVCRATFNSGMESLKLKDTSAAERALKEAIYKCNYPQAYIELSKIYFAGGTINFRDKAKELITKGILKNPDNIDCRITYAEMLEKSGYRNMAFDEYKRAYLIDSTNVSVLLAIGKFKTDDFNEFKNSLKYDINSGEAITNIDGVVMGVINRSIMPVGYETLALECFKDAEMYLTKALKVDSLNMEALYKISFLYEDARMPKRAIPYLEFLKKNKPGELNTHLYLGLLYYKTGDLKTSHAEFLKAIELMNPAVRNDFIYNTARMLVDPTETGKLDSLSDEKFKKIIDNYWKFSDPLFITEYNERLLEHYSRVAYADLRFGFKDTAGWKTDRGEVYLRYGEPLFKYKERGEIGHGSNFKPPTEYWSYDDFSLDFTDEFLQNKYRFSMEDYGGYGLGALRNSYNKMRVLRRTNPVSYTPKLEGPAIPVFTDLAQFKNDKSTGLLINYAIPFNKDMPAKKCGYKYGFFLFGAEMKEMFTFVDSVKSPESSGIFSGNTDTLFAVNSMYVAAAPLNYLYSFEAVRNIDNGSGRDRKVIQLRNFPDDRLSVSDIVLANNIDPQGITGAPAARKRIGLYPNALHAFKENSPLFIYYEVYNLMKGKENNYNFEQKIVVERTDDDRSGIAKAFNSVLGLIGLANNRNYLSLSSKYQGTQKDEQVYLQIDMTDYQPGNYNLTVVLKDLESGKETCASTYIRWNK